jgi:hypothetical protein
MSVFKFITSFLLAIIVSAVFILPVYALEYNPGVAAGQYVKYGNFVSSGPGFESFRDYDWLKLEVTNISGKDVTLLSIGQFKNGTSLPGNGTATIWNVEDGTEDGVPSTQGPIVAAILNQGDAIPPPNTYEVNRTEQRTYLGVTRSVNILSLTIHTPGYNTTPTYVYDRFSGMLLESSSQTVVDSQPEPITSEYAYSVVETNIFGSASTPTPTLSTTPTVSPTIQPSASPTISASPTSTPTATLGPIQGIPPEYLAIVVAVVMVVIVVAALALRRKH